MILSMNDDKKDSIKRAIHLVEIGDYKEARRVAKSLAKNSENLNERDKAKLNHILNVTGIDPYVVGGFVFTLIVLAFLVIKFVL